MILAVSIIMKVHIVKTLSDAQVEEIVALCCGAYVEPDGNMDIVMRCHTGYSDSCMRLYSRAMIRATMLAGEIFVATDGESSLAPIRSVALCFTPGKGLFVTEQQKELGYNEFMDSVTPETRAWCDMLKKSVVEFMESLNLGSLLTDGYWVSFVATDHTYKNHGFGTALMERIKLRAAEEKWQVGLVTHTEKNRDWYLGLGFEVAGVRRMSSKPYGDTFPCIVFKPYPPRD